MLSHSSIKHKQCEIDTSGAILEGKEMNRPKSVEMSHGSRQKGVVTGGISAPQVGYIDEALHNYNEARQAQQKNERELRSKSK